MLKLKMLTKLNSVNWKAFIRKKNSEQQIIYDKKIKTAGEDGFSQGQKDKQLEVETKLRTTSSEKEKKSKWNDVLFDVNN